MVVVVVVRFAVISSAALLLYCDFSAVSLARVFVCVGVLVAIDERLLHNSPFRHVNNKFYARAHTHPRTLTQVRWLCACESVLLCKQKTYVAVGLIRLSVYISLPAVSIAILSFLWAFCMFYYFIIIVSKPHTLFGLFLLQLAFSCLHATIIWSGVVRHTSINLQHEYGLVDIICCCDENHSNITFTLSASPSRRPLEIVATRMDARW